MSKPLTTKLYEGESVSLRVVMSWTATGERLVRCNYFILFFCGLFSCFLVRTSDFSVSQLCE